MEEPLTKERCVACDRNAPRLSEEELNTLRPQIPDWEVVEVDGELRLQRSYTLPNFITALGLTNRIGEIAEAENHHPAILTEWGKVTVWWWTHKIRGLHRNDVIMAAKTDEAAQGATTNTPP
jgi:4a-hydroxytetrahydrobiopterin dehydratase